MIEPTNHYMRALPKQWEFLSSEAKYAGFIGGVGSGKTYAGCLKALLQSRWGDGVIVAPTYRMMQDVTEKTLFDIMDQAGLRYYYRASSGLLEFNKVRIYFRSGENPERLRGLNVNWAWLDEAAMMREMVWRIILARLRVGEAKAWVTTTPAGFNWVWRYWKDRGDPKYKMIRADTRENRYLPTEYVEDLISTYTGQFLKQEIEGDFVAFEGLVYNEFSDRLHIIEPYKPGAKARIVSAIDFGFTNPFACLWGELDEDGRLTIFDEHYRRRSLMAEHAMAMNERGYRAEWTVCDHDAQDAAELRALGFDIYPAKKEIRRGIQAVKARLAVQADGKPRLRITSNCVNLLKEFSMYRWPDETGATEKEDPMKESDHAMDALRYMVAQLDFGADAGRIRRI